MSPDFFIRCQRHIDEHHQLQHTLHPASAAEVNPAVLLPEGPEVFELADCQRDFCQLTSTQSAARRQIGRSQELPLSQVVHSDWHFLEFEVCVKHSLLWTVTKLHRDEGWYVMCHRAHSGEVRGWIRPRKSGTNYTPAASSSLREFRIGSCEQPPATQTTKSLLFHKDLAVRSPQWKKPVKCPTRDHFFSSAVWKVGENKGITYHCPSPQEQKCQSRLV